MKEEKPDRVIKIGGIVAEWRKVTWKDGADTVPVLVVSKGDLERIMVDAKAKAITVVTMAKGQDGNKNVKSDQIEYIKDYARTAGGKYELQSINLGWSREIESVNEVEEDGGGVDGSSGEENLSSDTPKGDSAHVDHEFLYLSTWFFEKEIEENNLFVGDLRWEVGLTKEMKERDVSMSELEESLNPDAVASHEHEEIFTHEKVYDGVSDLSGILF